MKKPDLTPKDKKPEVTVTHSRRVLPEQQAAHEWREKVTILRRAKRGKIPSFRIGTMVRFDPQAISRWLLEQGVQSLSSSKRGR